MHAQACMRTHTRMYTALISLSLRYSWPHLGQFNELMPVNYSLRCGWLTKLSLFLSLSIYLSLPSTPLCFTQSCARSISTPLLLLHRWLMAEEEGEEGNELQSASIAIIGVTGVCLHYSWRRETLGVCVRVCVCVCLWACVCVCRNRILLNH